MEYRIHKILAIITLFSAFSIISAQNECNGGVECIPLSYCSGLYNQLERGVNNKLKDLLRNLHCGFDAQSMPMVCCPPEFTSRVRVNQNNLLPDMRTCGIQNNDRIVGGIITEIDEHPWMTLLRYDKPQGWGFYCGGVLISSRYVLTAAHCVKGEDLPPSWRLTQVRLGEWNTSSVVDCVMGDCAGPVVDVPIEEIIPHENYVPSDSNQQNDIALLRLSRDVLFNDFIKPICLPVSNEARRNSFDNLQMEVAGWGKTESRSESDVKLKVTVPVVTNANCGKTYQKVGRVITDKQICAGGVSGKDSCRGDSGGSLMGRLSSSPNWLAIGVVSYGPTPCGTANWPGVYTRVTAYVDWILSKLR